MYIVIVLIEKLWTK